MSSKVKNISSEAHFAIFLCFLSNLAIWQSHMAEGRAIWQSHMAEPYGSAIWQSQPYGRAIWQCHMAEPYGSAIWQSHMAVPYGKAIWQSHMARPYGKAIWQGHMARPYGRAIWQSHIAKPYGSRGRRGLGHFLRLNRKKLLSRFFAWKNDLLNLKNEAGPVNGARYRPQCPQLGTLVIYIYIYI